MSYPEIPPQSHILQRLHHQSNQLLIASTPERWMRLQGPILSIAIRVPIRSVLAPQCTLRMHAKLVMILVSKLKSRSV